MTISPAEVGVGGLKRNPLINRKANLILISRSQLVRNRKTFAVSESEEKKENNPSPIVANGE